MKIAYHYTPENRVFSGESSVNKVAGYNDYIKPQCSTWVSPPNFDEETEQAKFDVEKQKWFVELKPVEVTAYNKQTHEAKVFEDASLITDEYTLKQPVTQWDEWNNDAWLTNQSNKYIAEYDLVDSARRAAYRKVSDPLYMEAWRKESKGLVDEAAAFRQQADAAVELIKDKHPWPIQPELPTEG
ncbi:Tail fiber assembly protein [Vibrio crassostreae]|nr:Tail fiber assembly protein [Vibrio crassostreae]CAK2360200.1 Tail fiber assembly protein [Vibrio crassostreae]CAK2433856.1 Tail fiber assembly protein [Vibrio crassostreae]CAK3032729.1 Tail fiber assembly protein [Vibrio crassostreae]